MCFKLCQIFIDCRVTPWRSNDLFNLSCQLSKNAFSIQFSHKNKKCARRQIANLCDNSRSISICENAKLQICLRKLHKLVTNYLVKNSV